ncbi:MAG: tetratricopeptide repeat protein [Caldilineales bacterium]
MAIDREDRESRMGVAAALAALQRDDEALAEFRQISADWPDFPFARIREGMLLEEVGDLAGALDAYRLAVAIAPDNADAHFTLAYAYRRDGQLDQAIAEFEAGLALDPARTARQALEELQAQP